MDVNSPTSLDVELPELNSKHTELQEAFKNLSDGLEDELQRPWETKKS